ncbi:DUF1292 domain-containing protein [Clostridium sp. MD294]|uniref:DUF1292 domain-containing protein n=1 Tax=Clostridium sp. MD294 TaxID=97138 RepID=UPI0002CC365D|nr:DUF1292 domain-containing protein [Clostridium sp. MD294]NDO47347.1 DUF1292 domain-containing protein [Clostridium sp. MD294]USF29584.1 hypothetical protein C820_000984 [Clostridium sp. MD294]
MSNQFEEDLENEFEVVSMEDENGTEIEFVIIDNVTSGRNRYLLVMESSLMDEEEADAIILKEIAINADDVTYELVEEDAEFERVSALFAKNEGEYDVKID